MKTDRVRLALFALTLVVSLPQMAAAAPAGAALGMRLDRTYLVGAWTDDGDCAHAVNFTADGRFVTAEGARGGWMLSRDRLTLTGTSIVRMRIVPVDRDRITVVHEDGSLGRSTRCAAPRPEDARPASDVT